MNGYLCNGYLPTTRKKAKHYNNVVWTGTYVTGTYLQWEKKTKHYNNVV